MTLLRLSRRKCHAVFAGALDGTLVGLGAGIAEEKPRQPVRQQIFASLPSGGRCSTGWRCCKVAAWSATALTQAGVAVAQGVDADTRR